MKIIVSCSSINSVLQCGSCVWVCNSAIGTSDSAVIRVESSQGHGYSTDTQHTKIGLYLT